MTNCLSTDIIKQELHIGIVFYINNMLYIFVIME